MRAIHRTPVDFFLMLRRLLAIAISVAFLLTMGPGERAARAEDKPTAAKGLDGATAAASHDLIAAAKGQDIDGDPLPAGAIARLGTKRFRSGRAPSALTFSADGKALIQITGDGWLQQRDPISGRLFREQQISKHALDRRPATFGGGQIAAMGWYYESVDKDQQKIINWLGLFDQATGVQTMDLKTEAGDEEHLALSPDGRTLAYGTKVLHLIDTASQAEILSKDMVGGQITSLAFSADGWTLAIGGPGHLLLWIWAGKDKPRLIAIPHEPRSSPRGVDAIAFSPDSTTVAVGCNDSGAKGVLLFDVANGQMLRSYSVPGVDYWGFRAVTFSPNGKLLAANINDLNSGGGVALWEVSTGKLVHRFRGLLGDATFLAFTPDSRQLAAGCEWYSTMCVWNLETGEPFGADLPGHVQPPNSIRFLSDDQRLATAGDDGTVRIWNLSDSRQQHVMEHLRNEHAWDCMIRGMDASPDGKYVVSSSFDDSVRLWETATGREIYRLPGHGHYGGNRAVQFTLDSKQFASFGDDMRVYLWDVATGKALQEFRAQPAGMPFDLDLLSRGDPGGGLRGGCFSADGTTLIVLLNDVRRYSVRTGKELSRFDHVAGAGDQIAVSRDGRDLLWSSWGRGRSISLVGGGVHTDVAERHPVELLGQGDGKTIANIEAPGWSNGPAAFSPDGSLVALAVFDDQSRIELRKLPHLSEVARIDLPSRAHAVEFSHSGKLLAASVSDSTVLVWDLDHLRQ